MKCPKCGYASFNYLDECKKCGKDLEPFKVKNKIWGIKPGDLELVLSVGAAAMVDVDPERGERAWNPAERRNELETEPLIEEELPFIDFDLEDLSFEESEESSPQEEEGIELLELENADDEEAEGLLGEIELSWEDEEEKSEG